MGQHHTRNLAWIALLGYLILLGGTPQGEGIALTQVVNAMFAFGLTTAWVLQARRSADLVDLAAAAAVLLFAAAGILSDYPRESFEAVVRVFAVAAGFCLVRRRLDPTNRLAAERTLGWLAVLVSVVLAVAWLGGSWGGWLQASHWSVVPPGNVPLETFGFGHRHAAALVSILLIPATWATSFRRHHPVVTVVATFATIVVLLIDGSRNNLLAVLGATMAIAISRAWRVRPPRRRDVAWGVALLVGVGGLVAIAAPSLLTRVSNIWTVGARIQLWSDSLAVWVQHPLAGIGPGNFPFALFQSSHFQTSSFDPRHPDNAIVQLLVEAGLLGVLASTLVVIALVRRARSRWQSEPRAAWTCLVFGIACLAANPTDFVFLLCPAVFGAAFLVPPGPNLQRCPRPIGVRDVQTLKALGLGGLAAGLMLSSVGSVYHEVARQHTVAAEIDAARDALRIATIVDPTNALYWREAGSLALATSDPATALTDFERASVLMPDDPVAWRGAALAYAMTGEPDAAEESARRAVGLNPLAADSQIVLALVAQSENERSAALTTALVAAPEVAATDWAGTALGAVNRIAVVEIAAAGAGRVPRDAAGFGPMLLSVMTPAGEPAKVALSAPVRYTGAAGALALAWQCHADQAWATVVAAEDEERESQAYWLARALVARAANTKVKESSALALRYSNVSTASMQSSLLSDGIRDFWRYRHLPLAPLTAVTSIPSRAAGIQALLNDPAGALNLEHWMPNCAGAQP